VIECFDFREGHRKLRTGLTYGELILARPVSAHRQLTLFQRRSLPLGGAYPD
jgi:hypothetical protein